MSSRVCNILDLPNEILVEIISHFNARERLLLADSCRRLNGLVFGDQALLRDLDFSENGYLTTATNIQRYFSKEATCQFAVKVNIQNVRCMNAGPMLNDSIGRAINLVDINIHGTKFEGIEMLRVFLAPLSHLKRLSLDWPHVDFECNDNEGILQKSFSRLTYLSLVIRLRDDVFPPIVKLCQELEELRMLIITCDQYSLDTWSSEGIKLKNLKVVQFRGRDFDAFKLKKDLMAIVPDPTEWTDFHLVHTFSGGYFEKNVELCDELSDVKLLSRSLPDLNTWNLLPDRLLEKAIRITHEDVPEKFCFLNGNEHLLKIEEAKKLLKDPGYQVSYFRFRHAIGHDCDVHLIASAFPNVTELVFEVLSSQSNAMCQNRKMPFKRRLRKKGSTAPEEEDDSMNRESSFKILVENTPCVRSVTLTSDYACFSRMKWFHAQYFNLISGWKYLRVINLIDTPPIENGNFLIDIGEECQELEEVKLILSTAFDYEYRYGSELVQMLNHCRHLRKFSIEQSKMDNMSEVFKALSNKPKLETVRVNTHTEKYDSPELISSIEQMLRRCPKLTRFIIRILSQNDRVNAELRPDLERIVGELNRPNLVFVGPNSGFYITDNHEDVSTSFFPNPCDTTESIYL